jgi:hypothetical protein
MTQKTSITSTPPWRSGVTVCNPKSTRTTLTEELGYIWIVLRELVKMWREGLTERKNLAKL